MADNYLERQREQYEARKASWLKGEKRSGKRTTSPTPPMFHRLYNLPPNIELPQQFTWPFAYTPHPLCRLAAAGVQRHLSGHPEWAEELKQGKMFGVLIVQTPEGILGYLAAFSGILAGTNRHPFFVPPVYDLLQPNGFFKVEEAQISQINREVERLEADEAYLQLCTCLGKTVKAAEEELQKARTERKEAKRKRDEQRCSRLTPAEEAALEHESQFQKASYKRLERSWQAQIERLKEQLKTHESLIRQLKSERRQRSARLQQHLFSQFKMLNAKGECRDLCDIFAQTAHRIPPAGAGECAAPKLLQQAYLHGWKPVAMAEFWWGASPKAEIRHHGQFYPACRGKCGPILAHMLQGLNVEADPLAAAMRENGCTELETVYEDEWIVVINKPAGLLSVPGKQEDAESVVSLMHRRYPQAEGPFLAHRLDMGTSGLLLVAKDKEVYRQLQAQFVNRQVRKRYIALLDGVVETESGLICLPLRPDPLNRPMQVVDFEAGKAAVTEYRVMERMGKRTRVAFFPRTGRTHQLRVHAAHPQGLHCPIAGDGLYGQAADRLYLHAESLEFAHPVTGERIHVEKKAPF